MPPDNLEQVQSVVLPVAKRISLVFVVWIASVAACIYAPQHIRSLLILVYYLLSVSLYYCAARFDESMQRIGLEVKFKTKGIFWFVVNLITAIALHYLFFWESKVR